MSTTNVPVVPVNPFTLTMADVCALPRCNISKGQQGIEIKACGACTIPHYCCRDHQIEHYKYGGHKHICKGMKIGQPLTFNECNTKASAYYTNEEYKNAIIYYSAMIELTERTLGIYHVQIAKLLDVIVTCLKQIKQYDDAVVCLQRMLVIYEVDQAANTTFDTSIMADNNTMLEALGGVKMSKESFNTLGRLADTYFEAGNNQVSLGLYEKLVDEAVANFGEDSFEKGQALSSLSICLEHLDEHEKAEEKLLLASNVQGYGVNPKDGDKATAATLFFNVAMIQKTLNKNTEATTNLHSYIRILKEIGNNDDSPKIIEANNHIKLIIEATTK